jgi:hypothetical protein
MYEENPLDEPLERLESDAEGPMRPRWAMLAYRRQLIESGAFVPGRGQVPNMYRPKLWKRVLDREVTAEAQSREAQRLARKAARAAAK